MPASVLPNLPGPDGAGAKSNSARLVAAKTGDSEFDAVSRRQQEQLERDRRADHQAKSEARAKAGTDRAGRLQDGRARADNTESAARNEPGADSRTHEPDAHKPEAAAGEADATAEQSVDSGAQGRNTEDQKDTVAGFTFADLQALIAQKTEGGAAVNATASAAASKTSPGQLTTAAPAAALGTGAPVGDKGGVAALLGSLVPGKTDSMASGTGKLSPAKATLIDGLVAQVAADGDKLTDLAQVSVNRLQGTLDSLTQNSAAQTKPAEGGLALRSYATSIDLPVGHAQWGDQLVGKLAWLTTRNMQSAEIHLTPPDLGPMEVKVHVRNDQASVTVHSASPVVRDQLEVNGQRLRDLLSDNGLSLAQFNVSDSSGQSSRGQGDGSTGGGGLPGEGGFHASGADVSDGADMTAGVLDLSWRGEVDLYA